MTVPDFGNLLLWGIPLLGLANAISVFVAWIAPNLDTRYVKLVGGVSFGVLLLFVFTLDRWTALWPDLAIYGPAALWSFAGFLLYMDFFPKPWANSWWANQLSRTAGVQSRVSLLTGAIICFGGTVLLVLLL